MKAIIRCSESECRIFVSTHSNIHEYVATFFLPDSMLDYFDIVWAEEKTITHKHDECYKTEFHMYLDEKDNRPEELKGLHPTASRRRL